MNQNIYLIKNELISFKLLLKTNYVLFFIILCIIFYFFY